MPRVRTGESVLARAVRLIEAFGPGEEAVPIGELARRAALPLPTTSRLVEELVRAGWLERRERRVRIGYRLWEVASRASPTVGLREAALPFMEDLHAVVGHHTQLAVLEGRDVLFVERLSAKDAVLNYSRVAGRLPLHASSSGLVLLAHADSALREQVTAGPLPTFTEATIGSARALRVALAETRSRGYAFCAGHLYPGATGIAVPVRDGAGRVVAALSVIVPNDDNAYRQIPALLAAAKGIGRVLAGPRIPTMPSFNQ